MKYKFFIIYIYYHILRTVLNVLIIQNRFQFYSHDQAIYEEVVLNGVLYGAVMLFKDDIIERIVYDYPNAS